jgi:hypothetical protein
VRAVLQSTVPRGLHYVCSWGGCSFYSPINGEHGRLSIDDEMAGFLATLRII